MNIKEIIKNNRSKIIVSIGFINLLLVILGFNLLIFDRPAEKDSLLYVVYCVSVFLVYYFWFFSFVPSIFCLTMSKWVNKSWKYINILVNSLYIFWYVAFCMFAYYMSRHG